MLDFSLVSYKLLGIGSLPPIGIFEQSDNTKWKEGGGEHDCRGFEGLIKYDVGWKDKAVGPDEVSGL